MGMQPSGLIRYPFCAGLFGLSDFVASCFGHDDSWRVAGTHFIYIARNGRHIRFDVLGYLTSPFDLTLKLLAHCIQAALTCYFTRKLTTVSEWL